MKLISSKDFGKTLINETDSLYRRKRNLYDIFIERPLKLEMFVPCDDEGNVLENPICQVELEQYRKAKEKVLFEGFEIIKEGENTIVKHNETNVWLTWTKRCIEDLIRINPILTQNATKQFLL